MYQDTMIPHIDQRTDAQGPIILAPILLRPYVQGAIVPMLERSVAPPPTPAHRAHAVSTFPDQILWSCPNTWLTNIICIQHRQAGVLP